ncbi:YbaK/EbsC family protein [Spelaeicoccus albus]|uniref:Prolyl-tRNA editing enzyme YbaK/EbsC (Cys-tRNA(Pro) deacylase) n=1 Tax=Spelaeicoccus albus TaxID=1280376 RepID=A0A7Z0D435_9MICO|nr:YbaK/EbsC family protein [Spelaeicoccus albus]NYI68483.1 prolyl-tRNA editing enzyme YbaK/EbsC (Cys-tRNA(Pro) deacylase) [Spelaeicoccus albus]
MPTLGTLTTKPAGEMTDAIAPVTARALQALGLMETAGVVEIDPELSDTAAFMERYGVDPDTSANCVLVAGKREGQQRIAACMVLASTRADVNTVVRKELNVRKASFLPMDQAVADSGMEYGGITPLGLPEAWPVLIDARVDAADTVVIGSGVRRSKILLPGSALRAIPGSRILEGLGR